MPTQLTRILSAVLDLSYATPDFVPVLLLPLAALIVLRVWQSSAGTGSVSRWAAIAILIFGILDGVLLAALPRLNLSFGPVGLPLLCITGFRLILSVTLVLIWGRAVVLRAKPFASPNVALALLWFLNLGALACEIDGLGIEPFDVQVTPLSLPAPVQWRKPLRIVHLSDLHIERTTRREQVVIDRVSVLEPDLIVLTGDYLNASYIKDPIARREATAFLKQLHAPLGVYAVTARIVDPPDAMAEVFGSLDIVVLRDEVRRLNFDQGDLYLIGVSYLEWERDMVTLRALADQVPQDAYTLLLYHTPDLAQGATENKIDLYLAGHTHGGQIRLPLFGAVLTDSRFGKKYEQGLYSIGGTTLYVNRGIGMEGFGAPRARFLCSPEIVVVDLNTRER